MKLLIVDDQQSVHRMLEHCLDTGALGVTKLLHAENGRQALEIVAAEQPELMLLDIEMPELGGLAVSKALREQTHTQVIILSAYPTFEYARAAMKNNVQDYLLKPIDIEEIHRVLAENIQRVRKQARRELFDAARALLQLEILTASQEEELAQRQQTAGEKWYALAGARQSEDLLSTKGVTTGFTAPFTWGHIRFCVFDDPGQWQEYRRGLQAFAKGHVGLSEPFGDIRLLPVCYRQVTAALHQGFYGPHVAVYDEGYFSLARGDYSGLLEEVRKAAQRGGEEWMRAAVRNLFEAFRRDRLHPTFVAGVCRSALPEYGEPSAGMPPFPRDNGVHYEAAKVEESFLQALQASAMEKQAAPAKTDAQIVSDIKRYIDEHYDCEMSLEVIAAQFFINKFQVSRIFKKKYGIKYQEYIIQVRMEKAASLIVHSGQKLYEIAQGVGYNDPSYFSMAFKKYHGLTPNQYRAKAKHGNEDGE